MSLLSLVLPTIGSPSATEDPKTDTAFLAIQTWANGGIDAENLSAATARAAGLNRGPEKAKGASIIATQEATTSTTFATLTTPDEVTVNVAENGVIDVSYMATWFESASGVARAAIFIGANQLKWVSSASAAPAVQETSHGGTLGTAQPLGSFATGLTSFTNSTITPYPGDVTTGQALGLFESGAAVCRIVGLPAGTYAISVRFKVSSGSVTAKARKLWVEARAFG